MRFVKAKFTAVLVVAMLVSSIQPVLATDAYRPELRLVPGTMSLDLVDAFSNTGEGASFMIANTPRPGESMPDEYLCQGFGSTPCDFKKGESLRASLLAPACTSDGQINCIDSLSIYKDGNAATPAKFVRQGEGELIKADPNHNLTEGSTNSIWSSSQLHSGGTGDYVAWVQLALSIDQKQMVHISQLSASVMPVVLSSGPHTAPRYSQRTTPEGRSQVTSDGGQLGCVFLESNTCGRLQDFAPETRVKLAIRVENTVGGWFKGRMKAPNFEVSAISSSANLITLDAEPVAVPQFFARFDIQNSDEGVAKWVNSLTYKPQSGTSQHRLVDSPDSASTIETFRGVTKDTAAGVNTVWSVGTVMAGRNTCLADTSKVLGVVTTNAMVYQGQAPEFSNGALTYKVGGLHYLPDGKTEAEGTYDLVMRSETARCLYGFSKAPVSAQVSVTSATGEAKVATTVVSEKDGWLKMAAYGFTFSSPTISVRLSQAGTAPVSSKKTTITCISTKNKKLTKKVTAVNAKCPTGYKKKP